MSYLAAAVATPISIDAGITYRYVIPQQGATLITVAPVVDFDLTITFGSPAVLSVEFTGTPGALPTYHSVTLTLETPEGTLTQTLTFRVLETSVTQRVPSITNPASATVAPGASINIKVASDITATYTTANLPAGLSIGSGRITGDAPSSSGFNVITFIATNGGYVYKRYFVLVVGTGAAASPQSFFFFPPEILP